jgi:tRNA (uracil-5-)-methyltransferase
LAEKSATVTALFQQLQMPAPELFRSPTSHYRCRAEFRIWHDGDDLYHIMFDPFTKTRHRIDYFPVAVKPIADLMPALMEALKAQPQLRKSLYQIDYLSGLSGELLVSLIYKKQLPENWAELAVTLKQTLLAKLPAGQQLDFIGRARKQKVLVDRDFVLEQLTVDQRQLIYKQVENSFSQPNGAVNQQMLNWACGISRHIAAAAQQNTDLLELYCGNGNFSLALAPYFRKVVATELSKVSIKAAEFNIAANQISNVQVLAMSAEDVSAALQTGNQLKHLDLSAMQLDTVLVDPPRAGLDADTVQLVSRFQDILYISCNPQTLADNLTTLSATHQVEAFAMFDQFPYTHHMECGVWLRRITP